MKLDACKLDMLYDINIWFIIWASTSTIVLQQF